jgi:XTP/dITP diphosphohydrolase
VETIYYNTGSEHKIREFQRYAAGTKRISYLRYSIVEILETDLDRVIRAKAATAYEAARVPVIVEHSELSVDYLKGLPGPLIKPVWMSLQDKLCELVPSGEPRTARARSAFCYCDGRTRRVFLGETEGELAPTARGQGGFHWDPIFIPKGETRTLSEMTPEEKMAHAPSFKAYTALRKALSL